MEELMLEWKSTKKITVEKDRNVIKNFRRRKVENKREIWTENKFRYIYQKWIGCMEIYRYREKENFNLYLKNGETSWKPRKNHKKQNKSN